MERRCGKVVSLALKTRNEGPRKHARAGNEMEDAGVDQDLLDLTIRPFLATRGCTDLSTLMLSIEAKSTK